MNKGAVAGVGVVVVVAAYAGATWYSGRVAEKYYAEQLAKMPVQLAIAQPAERSYQRGFLSSRSTTSIQIGCPAEGGQPPLRINVVDTIRHGPIAGSSIAAAVIDSQVTLGGSAGERVNALFTGAPLTARTVVGFGGRYTSTVQSGAVTAPLGEGVELAWQGLSGTFEGKSGEAGFSYSLKSPGVRISDPARGTEVSLSGLAMRAEGGGAVPGSGLLGLGKGEGSLDAVVMTVQPPSPTGQPAAPFKLSFTGLKFTSDTKLNGELLDYTSTFGGAGEVAGAKIDRFDMQASMKRLHAPTYQRLVEKLAGAGAECDTAAREASAAMMLETLQADVMALLQHNPEISLDKLVVEHGGQRGEVAYALGVQGLTPADAQMPLMLSMMKGARLTGSVRVPVAWVRRLAAEGGSRLQGAAPGPEVVDVMLDQFAAQGLLVREGDFLTSRVEFTAGTLTVNGKAMPMGGAAPGAGAGRPGGAFAVPPPRPKR